MLFLLPYSIFCVNCTYIYMLFFPFPLDLIPTLVDLGPRKRPKRCEIDLNSRRKETLFKWVSGSIFFRKIYTEQTARHLCVRLHNMFWKFYCENALIYLSPCIYPHGYKYRISSYSFRGNYSFLNLEIQRSQYIICGNYLRAETKWGNMVHDFTCKGSLHWACVMSK